MPGSTIIGRVAVKVLPDTSNFKRDLQTDLDELEKRLEIKIPATVNDTLLKQDVLEKVRTLNAELRTNDNYKIKLATTLDDTMMRENLNSIVRQYEALSETNKVKLKSELTAGDLELDIDQESLDRVQQKLQDFQRNNSPLKIKVEFDYGSLSGDEVKARLDLLTRPRTVNIIPKVDNKAATAVLTFFAALSGGRVLKDTFDDFLDFFKNLDRSVPKISALALGVVGIAGGALTAAGNLASLSSSLALIAPAGFALPGILGGIAIGLGTTIIALKAFKQYVPQVSAAWTKLQSTIQTNFWDKAQAPINKMVNQLLPKFVKGFGQTATELGSFFGKLATDLTGKFGPTIQHMFDGLSQSIHIFSDHTGSIANIITTLGTTGSEYLPRLAKWFGDITDKFSDFLTKARNDGDLKKWINEGITNLKALGKAIAGIASIFKGIATAAVGGGGASLTQFAKTVGSVAKAINSSGAQKLITGLFKAAFTGSSNLQKTVGPAFSKLITSLTKTLTKVLPIVGTTLGKIVQTVSNVLGSKAVQSGLVSLFKGISSGINALAGPVSKLSQPLGELGKFIGNFASGLGGVLGQALKLVTPLLTTLLKALNPIVDILQSGLTAVLKGLSPLFNAVAKALGPVVDSLTSGLKPVIAALAPVIKELATTIAQNLGPLLPKLAQLLGQLLQALAPLLKPLGDLANVILGRLLPPIIQLITAVLPPLVQTLVNLLQAIQPLMPIINDLATLLADVLAGTIRDVVTPILQGLAYALDGVSKAIEATVTFIVSLFTGGSVWDTTWKAVQTAWNATWNAVSSFFTTIWNGIKSGVTTAIDAVKSTIGTVCSAISSAWNTSWSAVKSFFTTVWDGIKTGVSNAINAVQTTIGNVVGAIQTAWNSSWNAVSSFVSNIWGDIKSGVSNGIHGVENVLSNVMDSVKSGWHDAWSGLKDVATNVINDIKGIASGIWDDVTGGLKSALNGCIGLLDSAINFINNNLIANANKIPFVNIPSIPQIPYLAQGGIVPATPGGRLVVAGEAGQAEAVIPLSKLEPLNKVTALLKALKVPDNAAKLVAAGAAAASENDAAGSNGSGPSKTFHYHAAPGNSLSAEEDLFAAVQRSRFAW